MKKSIVVGLAAVLLSAGAVALAQPGQGGKGGGWCRESGQAGAGRMYDASKAETVQGQITAVEQLSTGRRPGRGGAGVTLKTDKDTLFVHLGPQWYLEQQKDIVFQAGDRIEVKGVKTFRRGEDVFLAAEVKKGGSVLKLRDDDGVPLWAGWRGGSRRQ